MPSKMWPLIFYFFFFIFLSLHNTLSPWAHTIAPQNSPLSMNVSPGTIITSPTIDTTSDQYWDKEALPNVLKLNAVLMEKPLPWKLSVSMTRRSTMPKKKRKIRHQNITVSRPNKKLNMRSKFLKCWITQTSSGMKLTSYTTECFTFWCNIARTG